MRSFRSIAVAILMILLPVLLYSFAVAAESAQPSAKASATSSKEQARKEWQKEIGKIPVPKKGCFTATYPDKQWKEVPCGPPSKDPNTVGGTIGNDVGPR